MLSKLKELLKLILCTMELGMHNIKTFSKSSCVCRSHMCYDPQLCKMLGVMSQLGMSLLKVSKM